MPSSRRAARSRRSRPSGRPGPGRHPEPGCGGPGLPGGAARSTRLGSASAFGLHAKAPQAVALGAILIFGVAYMLAQGFADAAPRALTRRTAVYAVATTVELLRPADSARRGSPRASCRPLPAPGPLEWALIVLAVVSFGAGGDAAGHVPALGLPPGRGRPAGASLQRPLRQRHLRPADRRLVPPQRPRDPARRSTMTAIVTTAATDAEIVARSDRRRPRHSSGLAAGVQRRRQPVPGPNRRAALDHGRPAGARRRRRRDDAARWYRERSTRGDERRGSRRRAGRGLRRSCGRRRVAALKAGRPGGARAAPRRFPTVAELARRGLRHRLAGPHRRPDRRLGGGLFRRGPGALGRPRAAAAPMRPGALRRCTTSRPRSPASRASRATSRDAAGERRRVPRARRGPARPAGRRAGDLFPPAPD